MSRYSKCDRCHKPLYGLVPCPACRDAMIANARADAQFVADQRAEIIGLLTEQRDRLARWIVQSCDYTRIADHACGECIPNGPMVKDDFRCAPHIARATVARHHAEPPRLIGVDLATGTDRTVEIATVPLAWYEELLAGQEALHKIATVHAEPCSTCLSIQAMDDAEGLDALALHWGQLMEQVFEVARSAISDHAQSLPAYREQRDQGSARACNMKRYQPLGKPILYCPLPERHPGKHDFSSALGDSA